MVSYSPQILTENEINGNKEKIFLLNISFKEKIFYRYFYYSKNNLIWKSFSQIILLFLLNKKQKETDRMKLDCRFLFVLIFDTHLDDFGANSKREIQSPVKPDISESSQVLHAPYRRMQSVLPDPRIAGAQPQQQYPSR